MRVRDRHVSSGTFNIRGGKKETNLRRIAGTGTERN